MTGFEIKPGKKREVATVSFVPGRKFLEDLISHKRDPRDKKGYSW